MSYNYRATMSTYTILAIDDSKKILDIIKYFLENEGYSVKAVGDPFEGIQVAQQGGIDLIQNAKRAGLILEYADQQRQRGQSFFSAGEQ